MVYEFDCEIKMLEGKMKWKVAYFKMDITLYIMNLSGELYIKSSETNSM
jgi:hypothetical protein